MSSFTTTQWWLTHTHVPTYSYTGTIKTHSIWISSRQHNGGSRGPPHWLCHHGFCSAWGLLWCVVLCCSVSVGYFGDNLLIRCVLQLTCMCCSVLQHVAACCSVLQCNAMSCNGRAWPFSLPLLVCCSVLQCVAVCCNVLQCVTMCCNVLQCVAVCCSVLQCHKFKRVSLSLFRTHTHTHTHTHTGAPISVMHNFAHSCHTHSEVWLIHLNEPHLWMSHVTHIKLRMSPVTQIGEMSVTWLIYVGFIHNEWVTLIHQCESFISVCHL